MAILKDFLKDSYPKRLASRQGLARFAPVTASHIMPLSITDTPSDMV